MAAAELRSSEQYYIDKGVAAGVEVPFEYRGPFQIRKVVQNGFRQLAVIEEKKLWKWHYGFVIVALIAVIATIGVALIAGPAVAVVFAAVVTAVVGTFAYFAQLRHASTHIAKKQGLSAQEEIKVRLKGNEFIK